MLHYLLIYIFIFISSSLYAQDSLKLYSVPKWKLDRLLDSYFFDLPSCDSTVSQFSTALDSMKQALNASIDLTAIRTLERDLKVNESKALTELLKLKGTLNKEETKHLKRKNRKLTLIAIGQWVLIVVLLL